jgi:potassium-transporting ATPase KdpC subunit
MRLPSWLAQHLAALRALLVFTVLLGLVYPLVMVAVARLPGLRDRADGSLIDGPDGNVVGSSLIGQAFTDADGNPIPRYFQSRPSVAGDGYDPTSTSASNLGPEGIEDALANDPADASQALLSQVCTRSKAIGEREGVDGRRPYCTSDGVGAVLRVFYSHGLTGTVTRAVSVNQACPATPFLATFDGVTVQCARPGEDYSGGVLTPITGDAPADPAVPADAVTASASGLDPHISVAYAHLQAPRVALARGTTVAEIQKIIDQHTTGRVLGFIGEPAVNVLTLNLALDRGFPAGP